MDLLKGFQKNKKFLLSLLFLCGTTSLFAINNPFFEILRYGKTGEYQPECFVQSPDKNIAKLVTLYFDRYYLDSKTNTFCYYADKYFPYEVSVLECSVYSPETENGQWLDDLLLTLEEERIAEQIENLDSENYELNLDIENIVNEALTEKNLVNKNSTLFAMEFENEILQPQKTEDGFIVISANDKKVNRSYYDLNYRLNKKEYWEINNSDDYKLLSTEDFTYSEEGIKPSKKTVTQGSERIIYNYNDENLIIQCRKYVLTEKNVFLLENHIWKYDEENRVILDKKTSYTYKDELYSAIKDTFEQKREYKYNWDEIPPDENYYEEQVLKLSKKYTQIPGKYLTVVNFDNDFSVKTYFKNDKKIKEVFYNKNEIWRVKDYEEQ